MGVKRRWQWVDGVLALGLLLIAVGVGMEYRRKVAPKTEVVWQRAGVGERGILNQVQDDKPIREGGMKIFVDVGGAVEGPGVYELGAGARIKDALVAAGGLILEADRGWVEKNLNQAGEAWDGMKIYIKYQNSKIKGEKEKNVLGSVRDEMINLNTASRKELEELPGIGPGLAGRIIEYRQANSGFRNVEEVKLVKGIGDKLFEKMKDKITI